MSDPRSSSRVRITTAVVGSAVAVVVAVTAFGAVRSASTPAETAPAASAPSTSAPSSALAPSAAATPDPGATVAVPAASDAPIRTDLTAQLESMKAVTVTSTQAGEIGGPAVRFTLKVSNTTDAPVSLADSVVNAVAGPDAEPAYAIDSASTPLPSTVPAGASVTGVYVFTVPTADRGSVTVTLDTGTGNPVVAFTGAAPR